MKILIGILTLIFISLTANAVSAQTTAFNYQGKLTDGGNPANGSFQMQFKLFDAVSGGTQIGSTLTDIPVTATNGVFSVKLDFGANALSGANRWLEISVRRNTGEGYTTLSPREQIASSPYAVRTLSAATADNALNLGGVPASEYVTNSSGGSSFIRNGTTLQTGNFNISGNGLIGGFAGFRTGINPNFTIDSFGTIRTYSTSAAHFLAQTTGGTFSWARFYMRSNNRSWFIGTSQNTLGDQFYLVDETASGGGGQPRLTIQPDGGAISFPAGNVGIGTTNPTAKLQVDAGNLTGISVTSQGNAVVGLTPTAGFAAIYGENTSGSTGYGIYGKGTTGFATYAEGKAGQNLGGYGLPKAMVFLLADGTISRCYNGVTGASTGNCGFTSVRVDQGVYRIDFGFQVNNRFQYLTGNAPDRWAYWNSLCTCTANQLTIVVKNSAGVDVDGQVMAIVF